MKKKQLSFLTAEMACGKKKGAAGVGETQGLATHCITLRVALQDAMEHLEACLENMTRAVTHTTNVMGAAKFHLTLGTPAGDNGDDGGQQTLCVSGIADAGQVEAPRQGAQTLHPSCPDWGGICE